jgi:hypothetical protein
VDQLIKNLENENLLENFENEKDILLKKIDSIKLEKENIYQN